MTDDADGQAEVLRRRRVSKRMTQRHLAEAARVSAKTVMRAEAGEGISAENLRSLCAVLDLDAESLPSSREGGEPSIPSLDPAAMPDRNPASGSMPPLQDGSIETLARASRRGSGGRERLLAAIHSLRLAVPRPRADLAVAFLLGGLLVTGGGWAAGLRVVPASARIMPDVSIEDANRTRRETIARNSQALEIVPGQSDTAVTNWVTDTVTRAMSFSFADYRRSFADVSPRFSPQGWEEFRIALANSGTLEAVIHNRYVLTAVVTGAPVMVARQADGDRTAWRITLPVLVTYQSSRRQHTANHQVEVRMTRGAGDSMRIESLAFT